MVIRVKKIDFVIALICDQKPKVTVFKRVLVLQDYQLADKDLKVLQENNSFQILYILPVKFVFPKYVIFGT